MDGFNSKKVGQRIKTGWKRDETPMSLKIPGRQESRDGFTPRIRHEIYWRAGGSLVSAAISAGSWSACDSRRRGLTTRFS